MMIMCPFVIATCRFEGCIFYSEKTEKCVFQLIMQALEDNSLKLLDKKAKE